jgi:rare lipoprotein A
MTLVAKAVAAATIVAVSVVTLNVNAVAETGRASWYALTSRTASGEMCDPNAMTAAHRSLPFGTKVKVEDLNSGRSVVVRINDRGPYIAGRVIDLTKAAAAKLGMIKKGVAKVRLTVLSHG